MNTNWKMTISAALLSVALTASPLAATAFADQATAVESQAVHMALNDHVRVEMKSVFSERTVDGTALGAVIRLKNDSRAITRVPDYELRMSAGDGTAYTLTPSADNPRSIQAKGQAELSYLLQVNRTDRVQLSKLSWVRVDDYVYPRREDTLLTLDIADKLWRGPGADAGDAFPAVRWGQPFQLPIFSSNVTYTPVGVWKQIDAQGGDVHVVTLKAVNAGKQQAFIPDFAISGSDGAKLYAGERTERDPVTLGPGEAGYVRFAIPTAAGVRISELVATTAERFAGGPGGGAVHHAGHVRIGLPSSAVSLAGLPAYAFGEPIAIDPLHAWAKREVEVSLVELHMHDNQGDGYKTAIAKFKLRNRGLLPAALPAFQAELISGEGYTYAGERQQAGAQRLMPGLSHVVSYAFNVPKTEEEGRFALRLLAGGDAEAPYSSPIAEIGVELRGDGDSPIWNLYPFAVEMRYWSLGAVADAIPVMSYSYKLTLDLNIERTEDVVVDAGFSRLKIEIADGFGRMLGSETIPFVGVGRLVSGRQTIRFNNIRTEQHQYPLTVNVYEVIDTPSGEASRLIHTLQQR